MNNFRPRLDPKLAKAIKSLKKNERRILCIGDLHCPLELDGYLEFCVETYEKHYCNQVVFIGDIIDNHYSSYHESDPNGLEGATNYNKLSSTSRNGLRLFPWLTL